MMSRLDDPSASALKLVMIRWRSTGGATARTSSARGRRASEEHRARLRAEHEVLRGARAGAPATPSRCTNAARLRLPAACARASRDGVADDVLGDRNAPHQLLQLEDPLGAHHLARIGLVGARRRRDDLLLLGVVG